MNTNKRGARDTSKGKFGGNLAGIQEEATCIEEHAVGAGGGGGGWETAGAGKRRFGDSGMETGNAQVRGGTRVDAGYSGM